MDVQPVGRQSMYEEIVLQIRGIIDQGDLSVGDKLPPERKLAALFGVSRNTVREAIKALSEQGVIESRQGAGNFVSEAQDGERVPLNPFILSGDASLRDIFEVRKLVEPEIAALAARNGYSEILTRLEAALAEQEEALRTGTLSGAHDQIFHRLLAEASGNNVFHAIVESLHDKFSQSRGPGVQSLQRQEASLAAHREIVEAVKAGHVMLAEKCMREHLEEIEAIVFSENE